MGSLNLVDASLIGSCLCPFEMVVLSDFRSVLGLIWFCYTLGIYELALVSIVRVDHGGYC